MKTAISDELLRKVEIVSQPDDGETLVVTDGIFEIEKNAVKFASGDVLEVMSDGTRGMNVGSFRRDYRNGSSHTNTDNNYDPDEMQAFVKLYIDTVKEAENWV